MSGEAAAGYGALVRLSLLIRLVKLCVSGGGGGRRGLVFPGAPGRERRGSMRWSGQKSGYAHSRTRITPQSPTHRLSCAHTHRHTHTQTHTHTHRHTHAQTHTQTHTHTE